MKSRKGWAMILVIIMVVTFLTPSLVFAQGAAEKGDVTHMQFVCAPTDGQWYVIASALWEIWKNEIPELEVSILPGGGHGNVISVGTKKAEMGMAASTDVAGAYLGVIPFENEQYADVRMLFTLMVEGMYTVTWKKNVALNTLNDIRGQRVNVKPKGYSSHALNKIVFQAANIDMERDIRPEYLGDSEAIQLMQDGQIDVLMSGGSIPDSSYVELSLRDPIKILPYGPEIINNVKKLNPGLFDITIPAGVYNGIDKDVAALGYTLTIFVHKDISEDLIYKMVKTADENIEEVYSSVAAMKGIKGKDLFKNVGVPYHPGAEKYIQEKGY